MGKNGLANGGAYDMAAAIVRIRAQKSVACVLVVIPGHQDGIVR
jgi:hypothetical protein